MTDNANKERISIDFSNKQIFNRRTIEKNGKNVTLVNIALPTSSQYKGYSITANADYIYPSKFNSNMSFTYLLADKEITIKKFDKETKQSDEKKISVEELRNEFKSWQKQKQSNQKENQSEEQIDNEQSSPDKDLDYEPIDM